MRVLGLLLLAAGIGLGLLWPWAQINFSGKERTAITFDKLDDDLVDPRTVSLSVADNPMRVRFQAFYKVGGKLPPIRIPVRARIYDADGLLVDATVSFSTKGIETGPELPKVRASQPVEFTVLKDGKHTITLQLAKNPNDGGILKPDIDRVTATFVANAPAVRDDFKVFAVVLALTGIYLILRGRRRKRDHNDRAPPSKPPIKWGRG